ncbi:MAG: haloacid dehalogenase-like hydrolase [Candidatus Cryptobacteroides sp.]
MNIRLAGALLAGLFLFHACGNEAVLPEEGWTSDAHAALEKMIAANGKGSEGYDLECRPYAVFDFDNTTIVNDISMSLMIWQAENMRYAFSPEEAFDAFTAWIPDLDLVLEGPDMSAREIAGDMVRDYEVIKSMMDNGSTIEDIRLTEDWLDFRAKLLALNEGVENSCDYATWCLWMPALFTEMTYGELQEATRESVDYWLGTGRIWDETWTSPDGKVSTVVRKGLVIPKRSKNLYKALRNNGIDVYVCSASLEVIVEVMACGEEFGLGLAPENVFGIRLADKEKVGGQFEDGYPGTFLEGKVECIRKYIAPLHGNQDPVLVAGDSSGDYAMLTSFEGMKAGLVFDCGRGGKIGELISSAANDSRYIVQPQGY